MGNAGKIALTVLVIGVGLAIDKKYIGAVDFIARMLPGSSPPFLAPKA